MLRLRSAVYCSRFPLSLLIGSITPFDKLFARQAHAFKLIERRVYNRVPYSNTVYQNQVRVQFECVLNGLLANGHSTHPAGSQSARDCRKHEIFHCGTQRLSVGCEAFRDMWRKAQPWVHSKN